MITQVWGPIQSAIKDETCPESDAFTSLLLARKLSHTPDCSSNMIASLCGLLGEPETHHMVLRIYQRSLPDISLPRVLFDLVQSTDAHVRSSAIMCLYYLFTFGTSACWKCDVLLAELGLIKPNSSFNWFTSVDDSKIPSSARGQLGNNHPDSKRAEREDEFGAVVLCSIVNYCNKGGMVGESDIRTMFQLLVGVLPEEMETNERHPLESIQTFGKVISRCSLLAPLFGIISLCVSWSVKHSAMKLICTLFLRPDSNVDTLLCSENWQSLLLPVFHGIPKTKENQSSDQKGVLNHAMFLLALPHIHCMRTSVLSGETFSRLLHETCVQIAIYSGWTQEGVAFTSRLLESLVDSIINANHWRHDPQSPYWKSIFTLSDHIHSFLLFRPQFSDVPDMSQQQSRAIPLPTPSTLLAIQRKSIRLITGMNTTTSYDDTISVYTDVYWDLLESCEHWGEVGRQSILSPLPMLDRISTIPKLRLVFGAPSSDKLGLHVNGLGKSTDTRLVESMIRLWQSCGIASSVTVACAGSGPTRSFFATAPSPSSVRDSTDSNSSGNELVEDLTVEEECIQTSALNDAKDFIVFHELFPLLEHGGALRDANLLDSTLSKIAKRIETRYRQQVMLLPSKLDSMLRRKLGVKALRNKLRLSLERPLQQSTPNLNSENTHSSNTFNELLFQTETNTVEIEHTGKHRGISRKFSSSSQASSEPDGGSNSNESVRSKTTKRQLSWRGLRKSVSKAVDGANSTVPDPADVIHAEISVETPNTTTLSFDAPLDSPRIRDTQTRKRFSFRGLSSTKAGDSSTKQHLNDHKHLSWRGQLDLRKPFGLKSRDKSAKNAQNIAEEVEEEPSLNKTRRDRFQTANAQERHEARRSLPPFQSTSHQPRRPKELPSPRKGGLPSRRKLVEIQLETLG